MEGKEDRETREVDNVSMLSGSLDNNIFIYIAIIVSFELLDTTQNFVGYKDLGLLRKRFKTGGLGL